MEKHLSRKELIDLAYNKSLTFNNHLKSCKDCRRILLIMREFLLIGEPPLPEAPDYLIKRVKSLIKTGKTKKKVAINLARLTFDSWSLAQPIGVRDDSSVVSRRVRFEAENLILDIRAEQKKEGWTFIAQINEDSPGTSENILKIGQKKLHIDPDGLYQWSSKNPPKSISIHSPDKVINIPELSWKQPQ